MTTDLPRDDGLVDMLSRVRRTVQDYLRAKHGVDDPVAAIRVARRVARAVAGAARQEMLDYARLARGAGTPWRDLVEPLGIDTTDEYGYPSDGTDAFNLVAGPPSMPYDQIYVHWSCKSCGGFVRDSGPECGHPTDAEKGHRDDCQRHANEIAAYTARNR